MKVAGNSFDKAYKSLNTQQKKAVDSIEGAVMVLAGPGTGKTQVVSLRIANILQKTQMNPGNILALTFTEAGVTALRQRLTDFIGPVAYQVTIETFHGFANQVINMFPHLFTQTQSIRQVNDADRYILIEAILNEEKELRELRPLRKPDLYVKEISSKIKTCKQESVTPSILGDLFKAEQSETAKQQEFVKVFKRYNEELSKRGWYDYEDTISFVVDALKSNDEVRAYFQERYQYILVDEYQDTNNSQNRLVEVLADFYEDPNLFVVGDDKQAIYRFQGASVANMLHFKKRYPKMKVISLTTNYRSTPEIIEVAAELISHNRHQIEKIVNGTSSKLVAAVKSAEPPIIWQTANQLAEWQSIITQVKKLSQSLNLSDLAVVFRRNQDVKEFSQFAENCGLKVNSQREQDLFSSSITKSVFRLLDAISDPRDNIAFISALQPILSDNALLELYKLNRTSQSQTALIEKALKGKSQLSKAAKEIMELHKLSETLSVEELINHLLDKFNFLQRRLFTNNVVEGSELLLSLCQMANNFSAQNKQANLSSFIRYAKMIDDRSLEVPVVRINPEEGLFVGTVHSTKGLEFRAVFMAGCDEKKWSLRRKPDLIKLPSQIVEVDNWQDDVVEDERRLFYVGTTRAKKYLYYSYPSINEDGQQQLPCQFLTEISSVKKLVANPSANELVEAAKNSLTANAQPISTQLLDYLRSHLKNSTFSYSDLRAYKTCPQQYLFSRVLRLPQPISEPLMYGNAVHKALELYFREYRYSHQLPTKKYFSSCIEKAVMETTVPSMQANIYEHAQKVLLPYWDSKSSQWSNPVGIEYSFTHHNVRFNNIGLTGKFDRIDLIDPKNNFVRVVDYKTKSRSISRNEIEGKTKNSDGEIFQQLVFYGLLAKHDRLFPYKVKEYLISIIDDKGSFKDESFQITSTEIEQLEKEIIEVNKEILSLTEFKHTRKDFDNGCEVCRIYG